MALDDLYVLDFKQMFAGQDTHNIFTYDSGGAGTATDCLNAFIEDMVPVINDVQTIYMENVSVDVKNLGDLGDNAFLPVSGAGTISTAEQLPLHDAVNFTLKPTFRGVRPGSKRFSGIPEGVVLRGDINDAAYITDLNLLRVALGEPISDDDTIFFTPIIVKRVKYNPDPERPDHWAYRFPEIGETPVISTLAGVLVNLHVSHQVSRY